MNQPTSARTVSVVVVSYNTGPALWVCLFRLLQLKHLHEVIIVSNGNEAEVELHLRKLAQKHAVIQHITGHGNVGFAKACNMGAQAATGEFVLLLNPDAVLMQSDALEKFTSIFGHPDARPPVAMVGGVLRNEDGSEQRASRRNFLTPANALVEGFGLHRLPPLQKYRVNIDNEPLLDYPFPLPAISGACMMMERERYLQLHGLDEEYFLHVEDMDLCRRVHSAGGGVWMQPQVDVLHYRSTSKVSALFVERMKTRGFIRYFDLHAHRNYVGRWVMDMLVILRLGGKTALSFIDGKKRESLMDDAIGLRQVQAIVRGVEASLLAIRQKQAAPVPAGSTVVITGASTAVGLFAIGRLLAYGCKVIAVRHKSLIGFFHPNLTWVEADLQAPDTLAAALRGKRADFALHCAPVWHSYGLASVLRPLGVRRIVAISSTSIDTKTDSSSAEERETAQKLANGEATLIGEAQVVALDWTILRPTMIYGAGLDKNITRLAAMIDRKGGFMLPKNARGKRAPVHADDVALAALLVFENPAATNKRYTIQGGSVLPYDAMVAQVFRALGIPPRMSVISGLVPLCRFLHPLLPQKVPHPAVAERMLDDLVFDDSAIRADLELVPRAFLQDGKRDLGVCMEETCRSLLPA
jgi:GT2 family glycosyltransferase/nucleoside-diphosphate-sugar epimerase